jgi:hypothetical protein
MSSKVPFKTTKRGSFSYAFLFPKGIGKLNFAGPEANELHRFNSSVERDYFVACDPTHRAPVNAWDHRNLIARAKLVMAKPENNWPFKFLDK